MVVGTTFAIIVIYNMLEEFEKLRHQAIKEIKSFAKGLDLSALENKYLGRKGELANLMKKLKDFAEVERPKLGALANEVKTELEQAFANLKQEFLGEELANKSIDVTLPGIKSPRGSFHPISIVQRELEELFRSMGFMVLDGPEAESEYYNFEVLNIPSWHPARDMQDTFYLKGGTADNRLLLRPHTSNMQVRALEKYGAPLRAVIPGRVFRYEATDASHEATFWQLEGLVVDKDISIGHLIATIKELLKGIFHRPVEIRLRPGYFPFVEPGFELDIACLICEGAGCSVCKQRGWVELLPCGLVHPKVIEAGGLDPKVYSGFAFGLGLSRLVMMRYKINDIRLLLGGDVRFLKQF